MVEKVGSTPTEDLYTTIINYTELCYGAFNSAQKKANLRKIEDLFEQIGRLPYCEKAALWFAEQKALLKKRGEMLADMDLMIASICASREMILVTNNTGHFARLKGFRIENWFKI